MKILCEQLERVGLSFTEASLYGVLCELRRQGAAASRSKGILEAIAFVRYTMGIVECDALLRGKRCWGAATVDVPLQRNQASPLQVKELESCTVFWKRVLTFGTGCSVVRYCLWCTQGPVGVMLNMVPALFLMRTLG